jgi:hypothetical protein
VRLTGTQIDALLAVDEATMRAALQRLRLRTTDTDTEQVGSAIVDLLTADRESVESALLAARVPDLVAELQSRAVQGDDDGEA